MKEKRYKAVRINKNGKRVYTYDTKTNNEYRRGAMIANKRACAKRYSDSKGILFNLTTKYLKKLFEEQEGRCKYSGVLLGNIGDGYLSPSIDRIDNSLGYIEGNVQWLSWRVNEMKKNMSEGDFLLLCKTIGERAETIPEGSTLQVSGKGSAWHYKRRSESSSNDDIVHSV